MTSFWEVIRWHPYRIFFPLGIFAGLLGVGHWAFWTLGYAVPDVKNLHLILESQGFLALFVVGFLLTAFPRFSGTAPADLSEILIVLVGSLVFLIAALSRTWRLAHGGSLVLLLMIPVFASRRMMQRKKEIPPSFLLLGFGLLQAISGTALSLFTNMGETYTYLYIAGRQMVQIGFLLCMVLGVTAKLAPFLMGYIDDPEKKSDSLLTSKESEVFAHGLVGLFIFGTFFLEPLHQRLGMGIRAVLTTIHLVFFAKIGRLPKKRTAIVIFFWLSCWMVPVGLWLACLFPLYRIAFLHVIFIGGFSLMIFSFGMLVVLSHSGKAVLLNGKLWPLKTIGVMTGMALAFRLAADIWPGRYMLFLHMASGFWVIAASTWVIYTLSKVLSPPAGH